MHLSIFFFLNAIFIVFICFTTVGHSYFVPQPNKVHFGQMNQPRQWGRWCSDDFECGYGYCQAYTCQCYRGYITWHYMDTCAYEQRSKLTAFLVSFFVGMLGVDWFVLSRGDAGYIVAGIIKLLVFLACCISWLFFIRNQSEKARSRNFVLLAVSIILTSVSIIWWLTDWIRVLADVFYDGYGAPLKPWGYDYYDRFSNRY